MGSDLLHLGFDRRVPWLLRYGGPCSGNSQALTYRICSTSRDQPYNRLFEGASTSPLNSSMQYEEL